MIPAGVQIYVALEPVNMAYSFERLSGLVADRMGYEARSGAMFVFFGKRRDALKVLFFDGSGLCVFYKRLDRKKGVFNVPEPTEEGATHVEVDDATLEALLEGIDVGPAPRRRARVRAATLVH
jgi:transposase